MKKIYNSKSKVLNSCSLLNSLTQSFAIGRRVGWYMDYVYNI